ncbi:Hypothetical Protein PANA_3911 [Pantoea ananatis LMG 20103]|uniref:DUF3574 domain-containing protein n=3 Tax=Pantoea ananas TaxID=553 RepID=D4GE36_PANAM|nr:Hypothetical Protein PANA_3911 [Pantoea ananatis LMG 20103]ASN17209.1 DUF3574 domain-containing protein [Pantoea ananatis]ERM15033.1 hypothetical protein L585_05465 [Pantoea ananatis BRT175]PKC31704.1 hypothetical protein V462_16895 [Pantoea ananatis 15320]PKC44863.1 hypothetical protein V461_06985 [Pantoea ananatis BRT98]BAK13209.1 hypothetical protein PAJ_3129 [Pantoea ananatis AJ13355]
MREQIISAFSNRHLCCLLAYSLRTPFMSHVLRFPVMLTLLLAGCHSPSPPPVPSTRPVPICAGGEVMMQTTLWFGLSKPQGGSVSSLDWMNFIDKQVTPRFKAGLSVYDAQGQWLGENGQLAREKSKALVLIYNFDSDNNSRVEALREQYKKQFGQESVMRVDSPSCVSF